MVQQEGASAQVVLVWLRLQANAEKIFHLFQVAINFFSRSHTGLSLSELTPFL